jgi:hypothetical protein
VSRCGQLVMSGGLAAFLGCEAHHLVDVELPPDRYSFSRAERGTIQAIANSAAHDVRAVLPALPKSLKLVVRPGTDAIPETGENATAVLPGSVYWTFDPDRDVLSTIRDELPHHVSRVSSSRSHGTRTRPLAHGRRDKGRAGHRVRTRFRESQSTVGIAPPEVMEWTRELLLQPETAEREPWLFQHPDGRRWIGITVGTFLVDRAARASGRSSAELVATPTEEILRLAR